jgi:hypothetical protein
MWKLSSYCSFIICNVIIFNFRFKINKRHYCGLTLHLPPPHPAIRILINLMDNAIKLSGSIHVNLKCFDQIILEKTILSFLPYINTHKYNHMKMISPIVTLPRGTFILTNFTYAVQFPRRSGHFWPNVS